MLRHIYLQGGKEAWVSFCGQRGIELPQIHMRIPFLRVSVQAGVHIGFGKSSQLHKNILSGIDLKVREPGDPCRGPAE